MQEGRLAVEVSGQCVELATGDALALPGDAPHAYVHAGIGPARFSLAVFQPGVGTSPRALRA